LALVQVLEDAEPMFSEQERSSLCWAEIVTQFSETKIPANECGMFPASSTEKQRVDFTITIG
jgi:hypothetical protein